MRLESYIPSQALQHFIKCYIIVECSEAIVNGMLPDTSLVMGFRYRGSTTYIDKGVDNILPFAVVAGLRNSIQLMKDDKGACNFLVVFNTAGARCLLKEPLHHLYGAVTPLHYLDGFKQLQEIEDKLSSAQSDQQRIQVMEKFLLSKLHHYPSDPLIAAAMQIIRAQKGAVRIKELAASLFISVDAFEKRFRRTMGAWRPHWMRVITTNPILPKSSASSPDKHLPNSSKARFLKITDFLQDLLLCAG